MKTGAYAAWPITRPEDWCGEFVLAVRDAEPADPRNAMQQMHQRNAVNTTPQTVSQAAFDHPGDETL